MSDDGQPNKIVYGSAFLSQAQIMDAMGISDVNNPMQDDPDNTNKCTFSSLVYLKPGSYCFTIEDQAPGYYVYTATLGQTILGKVGESDYSQIGNLLKIQPFGGVMFISANNQSWELKQGTDILFRIKRASFNTAVTGIVQNTLGAPTVSKSHFAHITSFGNPADCDIYSVFVKKTMRANSFIFLYRA